MLLFYLGNIPSQRQNAQISLKNITKRKNCPLDKAQLWEQRELDFLPNWHQLLRSIWQIT